MLKSTVVIITNPLSSVIAMASLVEPYDKPYNEEDTKHTVTPFNSLQKEFGYFNNSFGHLSSKCACMHARWCLLLQ